MNPDGKETRPQKEPTPTLSRASTGVPGAMPRPLRALSLQAIPRELRQPARRGGARTRPPAARAQRSAETSGARATPCSRARGHPPGRARGSACRGASARARPPARDAVAVEVDRRRVDRERVQAALLARASSRSPTASPARARSASRHRPGARSSGARRAGASRARDRRAPARLRRLEQAKRPGWSPVVPGRAGARRSRGGPLRGRRHEKKDRFPDGRRRGCRVGGQKS